MSYFLGGLCTFIAVFIAINLYWRYLSRSTAAPCPTWMAWMLELSVGGKPAGSSMALDQLDLHPGQRVADVGCGPGRLTLPIAQVIGTGGEVVALDMQRGMLDRMERRATKAGLANIRSIHGGAGEGLLPKEYFDRAILSTVLGEIPDRERALVEIRDALKPGGFLLVFEILGDPHYQFQSKVRQLAAGAGLRVGEVRNGLISYAMRLYRD